MNDATPHVIGALVGDVVRAPSARTKFGLLFAAVARRLSLTQVYDADLRGWARALNAVQVFHPNRQRWKERFQQNVPAFVARSRQMTQRLRALRDPHAVVLQGGALFDASDAGLPVVIYTDYTAALAARKPASGRSPFSASQRDAWIALERRALERATHICTRGQFVREAILADYHIAPERVTAIGGGVNFATLPECAPRLRAAAPTALFIGKDFFRKGGDLVLRAFAQVRAQVPGAELLMLTAGAIPAELPRAGVHVIAPTWDRAVIETLYRRADVFVIPSRLETWGDVLLEAMAFGVPCVGVAGEAMEEIIVPEQTGAIVPPENVDALAAQLVRVLRDRALGARWGLAARARVEQNYTWDRVVERLYPFLVTAQ